MAITSIGNDSGALIAAELLQRLETDLGNAIVTPNRPAANPKPSNLTLTTSLPALTTSQPDDSVAPPMNDTAVSYTPDIGRSISNFDQANFIPSPGASPRALEATHDPVQVAAAQTAALMNLMSATNTAPTRPVIDDGAKIPLAGIVKQQSPVSSSIGLNPVPPQSSPQWSSPQQYSPAANQSPATNAVRAVVSGSNKVNDSGKVNDFGNVAQATPNGSRAVPNVMPRISDVAAVLMSEVASSDIAKLAKILDPSPDPANNRILDSLLLRAVQEVVKGNAERAVGYLADYATRDPKRGEALPLEPDLAPVRDKIDSMVTRMTIVAKMTAEDGLSRAEQTASQNSGKISNWDTHADVLIKLAHRFFDAGGYANYSRTSELARVVTEAIGEAKPAGHALAASATASASGITANQLIPGVNVPYWASADVPPVISAQKNSGIAPRRLLASPLDDLIQNLLDLKAIATSAIALLWVRAPLLVLMLFWLSAGIVGGIGFFIVSHTWPDSSLVVVGNFAFNLWGLGFLALVGAGFYSRIRHRR